jgi:pSer/pThr/pTyr-binding forkhead associated (FHA) protein
MSRKHAVIKFKNGEYTIQDLNSSNGIIVNGQKQSEIILMHGDVIQIGQSMLTFMI